MIRTVRGDIDPAELGVTYGHEHLLMTGGWPVRLEPDFRLDSVDLAVLEVESFRSAGGNALVEMTPLGFGRDPDGLRAISETTGVHIVAATGFHKLGYYSDRHWLHTMSDREIAELLIAEIEVGLDRRDLACPVVDRSPVRAGVVKVATEYHRSGATAEKLFRAAAIAHLETGVPIATHTEKGTLGHHQLDVLEAGGVAPERVMLGHIDHNPDPYYLAELADRGATLVFDLPGRTKYAPDSLVLELLAELVHRGYGERVMVGMDLARRSYWRCLGGGPGLDYLLRSFIPRLRDRVGDAVVTQILVANPARMLSLGARAGAVH